MRRIQRDIQHEDLIKLLTTGEEPVFRDIWRVLLFASAYGVKKGERLKLQKVESNKAMPESYFNTPAWRGFLYLLGFAEGENSDHLKNDEEQQNRLISSFEEYANFGLMEMSERLSASSDTLGTLTEMLLERALGEEGTRVENLI